MKYALPLTLLFSTPVFAGNIEAGLDDPEVIAPRPVQSGQRLRACYLQRTTGDLYHACGHDRGRNGPRITITQGAVEGRCNTAECNSVGINETREQLQDRVRAARKFGVKR